MVWVDDQLDYRATKDPPSAGTLWDGTRATRREDRRAIYHGRRIASPYTAAERAGARGERFDPTRWPNARDEFLLRESWETGRNTWLWDRNRRRQERAWAWVCRVWRRLRG